MLQEPDVFLASKRIQIPEHSVVVGKRDNQGLDTKIEYQVTYASYNTLTTIIKLRVRP